LLLGRGVVVPPVRRSVYALVDALSGTLTAVAVLYAPSSQRDPRLLDTPGLSKVILKAFLVFEAEGGVEDPFTNI